MRKEISLIEMYFKCILNCGEDWHSGCALGLWAKGSLVQASSGVPSVVALSKSHFHSSVVDSVYSLNQLVAIKALQSLC